MAFRAALLACSLIQVSHSVQSQRFRGPFSIKDTAADAVSEFPSLIDEDIYDKGLFDKTSTPCTDTPPPKRWKQNTCEKQLQNTNSCAKRRAGTITDGYCYKTCGVCGSAAGTTTTITPDSTTTSTTTTLCTDTLPPKRWKHNTCEKQVQNTNNCAERRAGTITDGYCYKTCGVCGSAAGTTTTITPDSTTTSTTTALCTDTPPPGSWKQNTCEKQLQNTNNCAERRAGTITDGYCYRTCGVCSGPGPLITTTALATPAHDYIWAENWVHPAGRHLSHGRFASCACYACKQDKHDHLALPPLVPVSEQHHLGYYGDDLGMTCKEFCDSQKKGYHAADVELLASWSGVRRPAIVVVHGQGGSKDEKTIENMATYFIEAGYVVMAINYNSGTCGQDVGEAVEYLRSHPEELGVDPDAIGLLGWSLGGSCVLQAGYKHWDDPAKHPQAVIDLSGCGGKGPFNEFKDMTVNPPPLLVLHAEDDKTIKIQDCYDMVEKGWKNAKKNNKISPVIIEKYYSKGGHNLLKGDTTEETYDAMYDHFAKYLGRPCKVDSPPDVFGEYEQMDADWPQCKTTEAPAVARCGGTYASSSDLDGSCQ